MAACGWFDRCPAPPMASPAHAVCLKSAVVCLSVHSPHKAPLLRLRLAVAAAAHVAAAAVCDLVTLTPTTSSGVLPESEREPQATAS